MQNRAVALLLEGVAPDLLVAPVNALRLSLHPLGMAPRIANLGAWRAHVLHRLGRQIAASGDETLRVLAAELDALGPGDGDSDRAAAPAAAPAPAEPAPRRATGHRHAPRQAVVHQHDDRVRHAGRRHAVGARARIVLPRRRGDGCSVARRDRRASERDE
jgi:hypothetical protein